jgi:hypothetical protein
VNRRCRQGAHAGTRLPHRRPAQSAPCTRHPPLARSLSEISGSHPETAPVEGTARIDRWYAECTSRALGGMSRDASMTKHEESVGEWLQIIRGEYLEIPGLKLTRDQIQRFWDLDAEDCQSVLDTLLREQFLDVADDGGFVRKDPTER